ncbi:MAG: SpoIIE family protein phosphatase [Spirochaetaceae bacterium]
MRIKNKLTTVQLIMTITLLLSIFIFTLHMQKVVKVKNAVIVLNHLDTEITKFNWYIKSLAYVRVESNVIQEQLGSRTLIQKRFIDEIKRSSLYNNATTRDILKDLNVSFTLLTSKSISSFTKHIITLDDEYKETDAKRLIQEVGIKDALAKAKLIPIGTNEESSGTNELIVLLYKIDFANKEIVKEYAAYHELWKTVKVSCDTRLDEIQRKSIISTVMLLIFVIGIALYFNSKITNVITINLNELNSSLAKMTDGDFTSSVHIAAGDEFGDLARNFNDFIASLWKKLDSMNVIMADIGNAMNEELNLTKIQTNILSNVTNHIVSDSAALFTLKDGEIKITSSKGHFPPFFPIEEDLSSDRPKAGRYLYENVIPIDTPILVKVMESQKPMLIRECLNHPDFPQCRDKKSALYINSLMMVPLMNAGEIIGGFVVMRTSNPKPFSDLDFSNFSSFSDYTALTLDTLDKYNELLEKFEMQKEIGVAADIQQSLVPGKMPKIKGITSSAYTLAAKGVSGDYYDFFRMNKNTIGATVCDVAGKGVPASLVMVMIRTILRLVSSPKRGAAETLTMLNKSICGKIDVDRYATMAFFKIDLEKMKLNYSNAAHHPIQIYRQKTQKFYAVDSPGLPVGIDSTAVFKEKRISLDPGDVIFMYTDGFPEARNPNGDEYSTQRMLREIRLHSNLSAPKILDSVITDMHKFTARAKQHDDQTILIIKIDEDK